jgi:hypothetical protein
MSAASNACQQLVTHVSEEIFFGGCDARANSLLDSLVAREMRRTCKRASLEQHESLEESTARQYFYFFFL